MTATTSGAAGTPGAAPAGRTRPQTRAVHVTAPQPPGSRPLAVPLYQTFGFAFDDPDAIADAMAGPDGAFVYTRRGNPTTSALESVLADLEGGAAAMATASGMGAISSVLLALLRPGDHLIVQRCLHCGAALVRIVEGRLPGFTPENNAADVRERRDWSLGRVLDELERGMIEAGPVIAAAGGELDVIALGEWVHAGDVREALGRPGAYESVGMDDALALLSTVSR
ncbi:PLP-dependent transferase [Kitasatospora sp. NPDC056138]|uniref:PLP-dependent transferase n=1 Tax=Kitasatospora sp. NPDC056138 TaxID=3345724 RepID=UPI0035E36957